MEPGHDHAGASDARLTELLRGATARAYPALRELRARHRESVLAYARLCAAGESTARQLAAHAFTVAAREAARGTGPVVPWRHRLLLLTARLAGEWATGERSAGLDPGLLLVQRMAGPGGPVPPLLGAFRSLPPRTRGLLWYAVVEREDDETTATLLGVSAQEVAHGRDAALTGAGPGLPGRPPRRLRRPELPGVPTAHRGGRTAPLAPPQPRSGHPPGGVRALRDGLRGTVEPA
ncbi:hypothetical protein [Streptomyces pharetrae]|uniref:hypothetical protein n=1 Tax=Streptomyces pharetrae TaxID=291370 RepID=UPI0026835635